MAKKEKLSLEELLEQALVKDEDKPYELPGNWVWTRFGFLAKDMADGPFGSNLKREHYTEKREVRIIQLSNIGEDGWRDENKKFTTYEHAKTISRSIVKSGDIVIAKMMPAGRAIKVPDEEKAYILSSDAVKFVPKSLLNTDYLLYALNSNDFRNQILSETQGITRARTSIGKMKTYAFPLPPLPEQQRIVDLIESLFEKLDRAKELAQNAFDSFENRKSAILHKAFVGELTRKWREENGVEFKSWGNIPFEKIAVAIDPQPSHRTPPVKDNGIPYIGIAECDYSTNRINFDKARLVGQNVLDEHLERYTLQDGDFIIGKIGTIGKPFRIPNLQNYTLSANVVLIQANRDKVNSEYLFYLFKSSQIEEQFKKGINATTQAAFGIQKVRKLNICYPTLEEQKEIVRILDNLLENEQKAKELCDVIAKIDYMKKAILARAFRGELSTNNPDEESALELLKEVLKEKV